LKRVIASALVLAFVSAAGAADKLPKPLVEGLKKPECVTTGFGGKIYVTEIGEFDKDGDGRVLVVENGKAVPFAVGLDDPKGIVFFQNFLFVADKTRVWRIDAKGKATVFAAADAFPIKPQFLNDICVDEAGTLYVSDSGDLSGKGGAIFRIDPKGKATLVADEKKAPILKIPNGLALDSQAHLLVLDFMTGELHRMKIADASTTKVADGFGGGDGLLFDKFGRLFITDHKAGKVYVIPRAGEKPVLLAEGFKSAADIGLDATGRFVLVPDMEAGTVTAVAIQVPGFEVDDTPLPIDSAVAFPDLEWTGWKGFTDKGTVNPLRPIVLTHAGDGSNRVFVATQHGVIHAFPNDQKAKKTDIFLDIQDRCPYDDKQNEEGFLGLAFHPKYKENGEFFVYYTTRKAKLTNVISRFKVSKDNPNKADPNSEEELLRLPKPFWNHNGGTICFGPDGFLYIAVGDGGAANDPHEHGQNLKSLLGKVLRIDVNNKADGKNYAIPKDNPFVGKKDAAPEVYAYGLRNIWRMSFDRKTGVLWAGDVGQNLWEEIDLIEKGGNYGWNLREGLHPFGAKGVGHRSDLIEPIWEYHHDVGKSITGGNVYRGPRLPPLDGAYLYADYVSNKMWALRYDEKKKRVVANQPLKDARGPVLSFGEDEKGEVYYMTFTPSGKGIYWFVDVGGKK